MAPWKKESKNVLSKIIQVTHTSHDAFSPPMWPGILHKGNGENIYISQQPPVIRTVMGNGYHRTIPCHGCSGLALEAKLFAPVALACGSDGSIYVGDFNFVRRILPSGYAYNVLELK